MTSKKPLFLREEVHTTTLTLGAARSLAIQLSHTLARCHTLGYRQSMISIRCYHIIIGACSRHYTCRYRFLTYIQVAKTPYLLHAIHLTGFFFKATEQ
jgi:hypothetical protein